MKMVFLGPPGAGKGTLAALASGRMGLPHISTGDLFRAAIKDGSELGKKVKGILDEGSLVPDALTIALVEERPIPKRCATRVDPDGFPRTTGQAEALAGISDPEWVINFDVEDSVILKRLTGRRICSGCGKIYHIESMPPSVEGVCDACGAGLYTRPDDSQESISTRLSAYRSQTAPLVEWYGGKGKLLTIDGTGAPERVYERFMEAIKA
jgi:adenylate kinase